MLVILFTTSLGFLAVRVAQFSLTALQQIKTYTESDKDMATHARQITTDLNTIALFNTELKILYGLCPMAAATGVGLPALKAKGEVVRVAQTLLLKKVDIQKLRLRIRLWPEKTWVRSAEMHRLPVGPCSLPGVLMPTQKDYLRAWNSRSGFMISYKNFILPEWRFFHPGVRTL